jgi:hypothetical protein
MSTKTKPAKAAPAKAAPKDVSFTTSGDEPAPFNLRIGSEVIRPVRSADGKLVWIVPADLLEQFDRHTFVQTGRIVKVR